MAILMDTQLLTCDCGGLEFKVDTFKSFEVGQKIGDETLLAENTARKVLTCITCGKQLDTRKDKLVLKEIQE